MLEEHHGSLAGFDVGHTRAEHVYALHLMLNHEKLRDMKFGRAKPGNSVRKTDYEFKTSQTKSRHRLSGFAVRYVAPRAIPGRRPSTPVMGARALQATPEELGA
jgi:hypothetical protein